MTHVTLVAAEHPDTVFEIFEAETVPQDGSTICVANVNRGSTTYKTLWVQHVYRHRHGAIVSESVVVGVAELLTWHRQQIEKTAAERLDEMVAQSCANTEPHTGHVWDGHMNTFRCPGVASPFVRGKLQYGGYS